jgi:hypothetical protein
MSILDRSFQVMADLGRDLGAVNGKTARPAIWPP